MQTTTKEKEEIKEVLVSRGTRGECTVCVGERMII
jgi:hypothetical protein